MSYNKDFGRKGEKIAERYLKNQGYKILEKNFLVKGSEIDIIAEKNGEIHFVEVKTRAETTLGNPADAMTFYKRKSIIHGAKMYLIKNEQYYDYIISFDVLEIVLNKNIFFNKKINFIENAFSQGE